jgi:putative ABC transport system ATP-binding protein
MSDDPIVSLKAASKIYRLGEQWLYALNGVDLDIDRGETVAVVGPSGSGKSTLLNLIGCMDKPSEGKVYIEGRDISILDSDQLADLRARRIGMVFQFFNLINVLTAAENVEMPMVYSGTGNRTTRHEKAIEALASVDMSDKIDRYPSQLSGGERQRVAIARSIINAPAILLADEPTGNLDSVTGKKVLEVLGKLSGEGQTILIATHDEKIVSHASRTVHIRDGRLEKGVD